MSIAPPAPAPPRTTARGTPCAASWGDAWIAQIDAREQALGRRICGARTIGGKPCTLPSDHASGRCLHHGGFPLTGAPADNRNAVVHGLYSRRLMICGSHCPAWQSCPMGGGADPAHDDTGPKPTAPTMTFIRHPDGSTEQRVRGATLYTPPPGTVDDNGDPIDGVASPDLRGMGGSPMRPPSSPTHGRAAHATNHGTNHGTNHAKAPMSYAQALLKLPLSERPQCSYELAEYNATVTDLMKRTQANSGNAMGLHLAHQVALLTVMVSRAARALAVAPLTEKMEQTAQNYYMSLERPSAALIAFEKLSRELRRWIHLVEREYQTFTADRQTTREHELRQRVDATPDPDGLATLDLTNTLAEKESANHTAKQNAALDEIDRQIVDTLFARFKVKPSTVSLEKEKVEPKEIDVGNEGMPRTDDS